MNKINLGRVVLGGLLAGVVLNAFEILFNVVLFGKQMEAELNRLHVPPVDSAFIVMATVLTFVLGIVIVMIYALIRPRLGPGPKAAVVAALIAWFGIYFYAGMFNMMIFHFPLNLTLIGFVWGIVEYVVAALAGGWVYKEDD
jgi:hypothetical protein